MIARLFTVGLLALGLGACGYLVDSFTLEDGATHDDDISLVNGAIDIGRGCTVSGDVASVNGGISIGNDSSVGEISNVNGSIDLGSGVSVGGDIDSVNGRIQIGDEARVTGGLETVNGRIVVGSGSVIGGQVSSVNGRIELVGTEVSAIETVNSPIELLEGTVVNGALTVRKSQGMVSVSSPQRVVIGRDVQVAGPLTFETPVELYVHESASVGEIEGAEPIPFSGDTP